MYPDHFTVLEAAAYDLDTHGPRGAIRLDEHITIYVGLAGFNVRYMITWDEFKASKAPSEFIFNIIRSLRQKVIDGQEPGA